MNYARVIFDADENRVVWYAVIYDEDDNVVEMRPYRDKQDAIEYAELFGIEP